MRRLQVRVDKVLDGPLDRGERCADCGKRCFARDHYIVRNATWAEAGMGGWLAGHLHLSCLEKRLGRKVRADELLVRFVRRVAGGWVFSLHPDYPKSPECLEH